MLPTSTRTLHVAGDVHMAGLLPAGQERADVRR